MFFVDGLVKEQLTGLLKKNWRRRNSCAHLGLTVDEVDEWYCSDYWDYKLTSKRNLSWKVPIQKIVCSSDGNEIEVFDGNGEKKDVSEVENDDLDLIILLLSGGNL